jgi:hypothetical protein
MNRPVPTHSRVTLAEVIRPPDRASRTQEAMTRRPVLSPARVTAPIARRSRATLLGAALACGLTCASAQPASAQGEGSTFLRVRSTNASIATVLRQASELSATFRRLVETISVSDGTVYVEEGKCGQGVRACLVTVSMAGANRNLWVKVDTGVADVDQMGSIGHELQHAIEVLSDRTVTNGATMYFFYLKKGSRSQTGTFETRAAVQAGDAVRTEVRKDRPRAQAR